MASADVRDELLCSICLSLYTDPVTLRCGHNFCRVCIDHVLDTQDESGFYSCPECRIKFQDRPVLEKNCKLCNIVERFMSTQPCQEDITGICCTYCIHSPVPAAKSCLMCEASLCDNHLRVHSKAAEHILTDPSVSLEENMRCSVHKKILEYFCTEDLTCICVSCCLIGKHNGHKLESLDDASENKKKKLRNILQKLLTKIEKTEEGVQSLEERVGKAQEKAAGESERVTAMFIDIRRRLGDLEKKVLSEMSRREEQVSLSLSDVIQKLEIKKDELSRKMRHIEELCKMSDPLTVLLELDTGDLCDPEQEGGAEDTGGHDGGDEDTGGRDGGDEDTWGRDRGDEDLGGCDGGDEDIGGHDKTHDLVVDGITLLLHAGFFDIMTYLQAISLTKPKELRPQPPSVRSPPSHTQDLPVSGTKYGGDTIVRTRGVRGKVTAAEQGGIYGQGPADLLLDVNTAGNNLLISDDLKTATWTNIQKIRPETEERFQCYQVMSRNIFSSGRHYWDVEISRSLEWRVGMCYPSIDRMGCQSYIGDNYKSWCLYGERVYNYQYSVIHNGEVNPLPHQISSDGVRICLDYEAGQLSFYEISEPIRHLHTFHATFTEPLHAALCVLAGCIKVSGGGAAVRNHHNRKKLSID